MAESISFPAEVRFVVPSKTKADVASSVKVSRLVKLRFPAMLMVSPDILNTDVPAPEAMLKFPLMSTLPET